MTSHSQITENADPHAIADDWGGRDGTAHEWQPPSCQVAGRGCLPTEGTVRHGPTGLPALSIPLHNRSGVLVAHALVSEEDRALALLRWHRTVDGYAGRSENGKVFRMHRVILKAPPGVEVDHINRDRLDNRRCNLRFATDAQNHCNYGRNSKNTSGYKGVRYDRFIGRWIATITCAKRTYYLGSFRTPEEAAIVYDFAALALHREFAATNFDYSARVRQEAVGLAPLLKATGSKFHG